MDFLVGEGATKQNDNETNARLIVQTDTEFFFQRYRKAPTLFPFISLMII